MSLQAIFHGLIADPIIADVVSGLVVKYNSTNFSYLTSKAGYSDTGAFQTGANVIGVATVNADGTPNTGLAYDDLTDSYINGDEWMTRTAYYTAAAAAAGTLPTYWQTISIAGTGGQGVAMDPVNRKLFRYVTTTRFKVANLSGTVLEDVNPSPNTLSMMFYDPVEEIVYCSGDAIALGGLVYGMKKVGGVWTTVFVSWYLCDEGSSLDYVFDKMVGNGSVPAVLREQDRTTGLNIVQYPYPLASMSSVGEGFLVDSKDGTFWIQSDQNFHGGITNGNRLWHTDPRALYLKYLRFPDMAAWSTLWKLNGNTVTGRVNGETLVGKQFSVGPVIDFQSFTDQQNINNWVINRGGEAAIMEWRGSSSAPTTTPEPVVEYLTPRLYDANDTNDGWGSTTPGAWQSTPTTDRYMQVRIRPTGYTPPSPTWTPEDLPTLKYWYSTKQLTTLSNEYKAMYVQSFASNAIDAMIEVVGKVMNLANSTTFRPTVASSPPLTVYASASQQSLSLASNVGTMATNLGAQCEITVVAYKPFNTARAIFFSMTNTGTTTSNITLQHFPSNSAPNNYLCIEYTTSGGTVNRMGITDTNLSTPRMISFLFGVEVSPGVFENQIYINKVKQTLTVNTGANTGQSFDLIQGTVNNARFGRKAMSSGSLNSDLRQRDVVMTGLLTTQERSDLYDYFQAEGQIP